RIGREPDTPDSDESKKVEPMQRDVVSVKGRCDDPVSVDHTHQQNQQSDCCNRADTSLSESREKQEKRNKELKRNQSGRDPLPAVVDSAQIPLNLFGKVAGPYDQELRKRQVGPEHDKSQQQVAQIMKAVRQRQPGEWSAVRKQCKHSNRKS